MNLEREREREVTQLESKMSIIKNRFLSLRSDCIDKQSYTILEKQSRRNLEEQDEYDMLKHSDTKNKTC